jgi:S1-C subfamily serine protease
MKPLRRTALLAAWGTGALSISLFAALNGLSIENARADNPSLPLPSQSDAPSPNSDASYQQALGLLLQPGAKSNIEQARALLLPHAAAGDPRASNLLGLSFDPLWNLGADTSALDAARHYGTAASLGYDAATHNLNQLVAKERITAAEAATFNSQKDPIPAGAIQDASAPAEGPVAGGFNGTTGSKDQPQPLTSRMLQGEHTHSQPSRTDPRTIFSRVAPAVVELRSQENYGSGVILGFVRVKGTGLSLEGATPETEIHLGQTLPPNDVLNANSSHLLIATNAHVVQGSRNLKVGIGLKGEGESIVQLAARAICPSQNPQEDLAFVLVEESLLGDEVQGGLSFLRLYEDETYPTKGSVIYALGNPEGLTRTITQGLYNGMRPEGIQFDAPISVGSSGGALVDEGALLLGITSGFVAGRDSQNLNFALPAARILQNLRLGQSLCKAL